jgi:hypothetical protein
MQSKRLPPTPKGCDKKLWKALVSTAAEKFGDELADGELSLIEAVCRADRHARRTDEESQNAPLVEYGESTKAHPAHALAVAAASSLRQHHRAYRQMLESRKVPEGKGQVGKRKTGARAGVPQPAKGGAGTVSWLDEIRQRAASD